MGWTGRTSSQRPRYVMATALNTWSTACTLAPSVDTRIVVYTVEAGIANGWQAVWMPANEDDTWAATASTDSRWTQRCSVPGSLPVRWADISRPLAAGVAIATMFTPFPKHLL